MPGKLITCTICYTADPNVCYTLTVEVNEAPKPLSKFVVFVES